MAKVSVRALRRELKAEREQAAEAKLRLGDENLRLSLQLDSRNAHIRYLSDRNVDLNRDLRKEQQFSELVTGCLHGVLAMTMNGKGMPATGMISPDTERL